MEESQSRPDESSETDAADIDHTRTFTVQRIVWAVISVVFIGYLVFGNIEARIWSFGRLYFKDRQITHVWAYFGDRLPDMPASPLMPVLYYVSLGVMVAGTVVGLWLFLVSDSDTAVPAVPGQDGAYPSKGQTEDHG